MYNPVPHNSWKATSRCQWVNPTLSTSAQSEESCPPEMTVKWQPSDEPHLIAHNTRPLLLRVKPCMPPTSDIVSSCFVWTQGVYTPNLMVYLSSSLLTLQKTWCSAYYFWTNPSQFFSSIESQTFGWTQIQSGALGKIPHIGRSQYPYFIGLIFVHFIFFKANMF